MKHSAGTNVKKSPNLPGDTGISVLMRFPHLVLANVFRKKHVFHSAETVFSLCFSWKDPNERPDGVMCFCFASADVRVGGLRVERSGLHDSGWNTLTIPL